MVAEIPNPGYGNIGGLARLMHATQLHPGEMQQAVEKRLCGHFTTN